ncbi:MAG: sigma-70 family RNA polymerase sigma factor [Polyangiaceae bacterium]|nr:sigma-70 family RNA polymerase sigma factor [Polyangiaceae bacterium]
MALLSALAPAPKPPSVVPSSKTTGEAVPCFDEVYAEHFAFVWRSARRLGTPRASLDDVVQDVFFVVHRRLSGFEGRSSIKTWLFGILMNVIRAHQRAAGAGLWRAKAQADLEALSDPAAGPLDRLAQAEAARLIDHVLDALDDDKRAVFVLIELEQMSAPDVARALGVPLNTVYSRLRLGRQAFTEAAARYRARERGGAR